jgi:hypothetical protein
MAQTRFSLTAPALLALTVVAVWSSPPFFRERDLQASLLAQVSQEQELASDQIGEERPPIFLQGSGEIPAFTDVYFICTVVPKSGVQLSIPNTVTATLYEFSPGMKEWALYVTGDANPFPGRLRTFGDVSGGDGTLTSIFGQRLYYIYTDAGLSLDCQKGVSVRSVPVREQCPRWTCVHRMVPTGCQMTEGELGADGCPLHPCGEISCDKNRTTKTCGDGSCDTGEERLCPEDCDPGNHASENEKDAYTAACPPLQCPTLPPGCTFTGRQASVDPQTGCQQCPEYTCNSQTTQPQTTGVAPAGYNTNTVPLVTALPNGCFPIGNGRSVRFTTPKRAGSASDYMINPIYHAQTLYIDNAGTKVLYRQATYDESHTPTGGLVLYDIATDTTRRIDFPSTVTQMIKEKGWKILAFPLYEDGTKVVLIVRTQNWPETLSSYWVYDIANGSWGEQLSAIPNQAIRTNRITGGSSSLEVVSTQVNAYSPDKWGIWVNDRLLRGPWAYRTTSVAGESPVFVYAYDVLSIPGIGIGGYGVMIEKVEECDAPPATTTTPETQGALPIRSATVVSRAATTVDCPAGSFPASQLATNSPCSKSDLCNMNVVQVAPGCYQCGAMCASCSYCKATGAKPWNCDNENYCGMSGNFCTDSDGLENGGINYEKKGTVNPGTGHDGERADSCVSDLKLTVSQDRVAVEAAVITELSCPSPFAQPGSPAYADYINKKIQENTTRCPGANARCIDGACVSDWEMPVESCSDSDGLDPTKAGEVSIGTVKIAPIKAFKDVCLYGGSNYVEEWDCKNGNTLVHKILTCAEGSWCKTGQAACTPGLPVSPRTGSCGDKVCAYEEKDTCPEDCTETSYCGDGICALWERRSTCPGDCPLWADPY